MPVHRRWKAWFIPISRTPTPMFGKTRHRDGSVGGIDWGWRNPFAAIWGVLDRDDVLWIQEERYLRADARCMNMSWRLPKGCMWYADPAGRTEMEEFRAAGHTIRKGANDIRLGITAVTARLRTGRLKINPRRCANLVAEAKLYRYPSSAERALAGENPVDDNNHALGALRYLVSRLDSRFMGKLRGPAKDKSESERQRAGGANSSAAVAG